jgi:hypothetical protein
MAGLPNSIVEKASVAGQVMRSKIATNFKDVFEMAPEQNSREAGQKSVKHLNSGVENSLKLKTL